MTLTATDYSIWAAGFASHALLAGVMLKKERYRNWPSLFTLAIFEMVLTAVLFASRSHCAPYFYIFWLGAILRTFIGLWLVFDVVKALPGIQYAPRSLALGFVSLAIGLAIGSAWLASSGGTQTFHLEMMAGTLQRCMQVIWGTFTITLFAGIGFCGLGWTPTPLKMASSVLILILASCANAYAVSKWPVTLYPHLHLRIDEIFNFCIIGIKLSWSAIMKNTDARQRAFSFPTQPQTERGSGI